MREPEVLVRFRPSGQEAYVLPGTHLVEAAAEAGLVLDVPCGGEGLCGKCRVLVLTGAAEPTSTERNWLSTEELQVGWRLACQTTVTGPTEVEIPSVSPVAPEHKILVDIESLPRAADIGRRYPDADAMAVALDLGTTTLAGMLLDIGTGSRLAVDARLNPQTQFGDDVLSRIHRARQEPNGTRVLHETIVEAVNAMIGELCRTAGVPRERVYEISVAGNTTMQHFFLGVNPSTLGELPFTATIDHAVLCPAADLGINIHPRGDAYVLPIIGGFIGGDTVAGMMVTALADCEKPTLLIDIGTNGEIVLSANGRLSATSTAAGPAFEGARISQGMRGCTGAIEKVVVDGRLRSNVIGNVPPVGLCGSGLIDAAAELLRHGLLASSGRLQSRDQLPPNTLPDLAERIVTHEGQPAFLLASESETADGRPILLTQRDIRELQLAAGAIRAGVTILLQRAGLTPSDLDRVLIAGGFGNFIRRRNALRIGLLPSEIEHRRIRYVGNTSLAGAQLLALSLQARTAAEHLARRTEHLDLSTHPAFHDEFSRAMVFPGK